ncbi:sigma factor [Paenibacillus thiaminolyticus]
MSNIKAPFVSFYQRHKQQVYYAAYSIVRDHFLAQDVMQETFLKAYQH